MDKILIVEDSKMFVSLLTKRVTADFGLTCDTCSTYQEAVNLFAQGQTDYLLAVLDLTLPGSPDGEIVDLVKAQGIPVVVVSGRIDALIRDKILEKQVLDYIMKGPHTLDLLSTTISRFLRNRHIQILLVEDSKLVRDSTQVILENQKFSVIVANDGLEAVQKLQKHPDIRLVITDYNMPKMDGFELTAQIRKHYTMDKIAIIGMSAHGNPLLSAQFLKRGANDFINKPYFEEELVWRVHQNVEMIMHLQQLREYATKDALTGLYNRRYFFEAAGKFYAQAQKENLPLAVAMIDIDHFKQINDTYGHACGDSVIQKVALVLRNSFSSADIVARIGGEEFIVMTSQKNSKELHTCFDQLCQKIAQLDIREKQEKVSVSVSIGINCQLENSLDKTISHADELLYEAKHCGRNRVVSNAPGD